MNLLNKPLTSTLARNAAATAGLASLALAATPFLGDTLSTTYAKDQVFTVSVKTDTTSKSETQMTMDGEPMDRGGRGGGGGATERTLSYTYTDTPLEVKDGAPTKVERTFDEVSGSLSMEMRGEPMDIEVESAFEGLTIVFTDKAGEVEAEVTDGDAPSDDERLEGHRLALPLDGLLPDDEVEAGESWDIETDALLVALGLDLESKLVDRPERGGGGGRGGRGGGRSGGGSALAPLATCDWSTTATYSDETEDVDGVECVIIEIKAEVEGSVERSFGGRGRDREPHKLAPGASSSYVPQETDYTGEFEGRLLWSLAQNRPVQFTFEGSFESEMEFERDSERGLMEITRDSETSVSITIDVGAQAKDSDG
jgi:hypothetical protein